MPVANFGGGSIRYQTTGKGRPLVLLLPQSSGPRGIQPIIELLGMQFCVITYDQRGTGGSSPAPDGMSMAAQADDVIGLIDSLKLESVSLLCHSTGCGIGISVAAAQPQRIANLVLAAPWTHGDRYLTHMQKLRIAAAQALDPVSYARFNAAILFPPQYRREHEDGFDDIARRARERPQNAGDIERRLNAILAFDARKLLPGITSRTLVGVARDDQLMPPWFAQEAAHLIPGAQLVELDGGGHMLLETQTQEFAELTIEFLNGR